MIGTAITACVVWSKMATRLQDYSNYNIGVACQVVKLHVTNASFQQIGFLSFRVLCSVMMIISLHESTRAMEGSQSVDR